MKKIWLTFLVVLSLISVNACGVRDTSMERIQTNGVVRVGVKMDVPGFGYLNPTTGELEGIEIELAKLIAEDLLGDRNAIRMYGVTAQTRESMLEKGDLDFVIATFTITEQRMKRFHFTQPYFKDELSFLVKNESTINKISDIDKRTVGIVNSGTAYDALVQEAKKLNIEPVYKMFASYPEINQALLVGEVEAFSVDRSILVGYKNTETRIIEEGFNEQAYGIATAKNSNELAQYLDIFVLDIHRDGRLNSILSQWGHGAIK